MAAFFNEVNTYNDLFNDIIILRLFGILYSLNPTETTAIICFS